MLRAVGGGGGGGGEAGSERGGGGGGGGGSLKLNSTFEAGNGLDKRLQLLVQLAPTLHSSEGILRPGTSNATELR